mmetsp:Transcript_22828/g.37570  ORF Transcript_22828/g.37570 Transcript_22828/m.37570 type:complete len:118 (-) Transcript_22828:479-832(-)
MIGEANGIICKRKQAESSAEPKPAPASAPDFDPDEDSDSGEDADKAQLKADLQQARARVLNLEGCIRGGKNLERLLPFWEHVWSFIAEHVRPDEDILTFCFRVSDDDIDLKKKCMPA